MEKITLDQDIKVFYVTAASFPDGIVAAHGKLHALVPHSKKRRYFGLSRPENNQGIVYKAATEELLPGEAEKYKCETMWINKGNYLSFTIHDYAKNPQAIEQAFKKILGHSDLDPQGYCIECYLNDETSVRCMVRLKN